MPFPPYFLRHGVAIFFLAMATEGYASPPVIAVDIGHNLARPGATSARGVPEFFFNKQLGIKVRDALESHGFQILSIGADGSTMDLKERTAQAKNADFFLSLHHDSVQPQYLESWQSPDGSTQKYSDRYSGFSIFVSRKNPYVARSLACASELGERLRQAGFHPSEHHAEPIAGENRPFADRLNGVYYFDDLVVLKTATQPALLFEAGIIVNRKDEVSLGSQEIRQRIADAVADAMEQSFQGTEGNTPRIPVK